MYYVYIIKSKANKTLYIGSTNDLIKRLKEHNDGESLATKRYCPWELVYEEGYFLEEDARYREKSLKYFGKVYTQLKRRIKKSINKMLKRCGVYTDEMGIEEGNQERLNDA